MAILLDTDHISVLHRRERPAVELLEHRLDQVPGDDVKVSIISFQEQVQGWLAYIRRSRKPLQLLKGFFHLQETLRYFSAHEVLPFDQAALTEFLILQKQRLHVGTNDLRIAAIARANGATLLSRNLRDFRLVPGLDVEDWTA